MSNYAKCVTVQTFFAYKIIFKVHYYYSSFTLYEFFLLLDFKLYIEHIFLLINFLISKLFIAKILKMYLFQELYVIKFSIYRETNIV